MQRISLDSYPLLREQSILHLTPVGARVIGGEFDGEVMGYHIKPLLFATINITAREVLRHCDGETKISDIIRLLADKNKVSDEKSEVEKVRHGVLEFISEALKYKIIKLDCSPSLHRLNITGSDKCFIPQHMSVELTSECNLECLYCYRESGPHRTDWLSGDQLIGVLKRLAEKGLRSVEITGGEPLLHPDFDEILEFCVDTFHQIALLTNGTLIDERIAKRLKEGNVLVQLDLDGSCGDLHDAIRGRAGAFRRTKWAIRTLVKHGVSVRVAMNVIKENIFDIENTLLLSKDQGVTWFAFAPVMSFGRANNIQTSFSAKEVQFMADLRKRLSEEHGSFFTNLSIDKFCSIFENNKNCGAGYRAAVLGPKGRVRPCVVLSEDYVVVGDLTKESVEKVFF